MALSIMLFHYASWQFGDLNSENFLGKMGIYGVSTFFVLSGISLAIIYDKTLVCSDGIKSFFVRRIFRILPLMWLATSIILIMRIRGQAMPSMYTTFLNYTTLFGFIEPNAYLTTGAWSIGNKMVFYAFMPLMIFLYNKSNLLEIFLWFLLG